MNAQCVKKLEKKIRSRYELREGLLSDYFYLYGAIQMKIEIPRLSDYL